jgi:hypothetical protein
LVCGAGVFGASCGDGLPASCLQGKVHAGVRGREYSVYGLDNKPVACFVIAKTYYMQNSIGKKYREWRKIL